MIHSVKIPDAGFGIVEGRIVKWHKNPGDKVNQGEVIVSVETEKITVDIPAECTGILKEILHQEGENLPVGTVIGVIEDAYMHGKLQKLVESSIETSNVDQEKFIKPRAEKSFPKKLYGERTLHEQIGIEEKVFMPEGHGKVTHSRPEKVSPAAKALAKAHGIDLSILGRGSGPGGRIVKTDVEQFIIHKLTPGKSLKDVVKDRFKDEKVYDTERRILFQGWQKVMASRMMASARKIPQYTLSIEVDVTELGNLIQSKRENYNLPKLTYLPFIMRAVVEGIGIIPEVNAYCDDEGYTIQSDVNIGVAVDQGDKLIVPVIKKVQEKSIVEIAIILQRLIQNARSDNLTPDDVTGGTFTITNVGIYGIHSGTSLILPPQTAILYMGAATDMPAVISDTIAIRKRMLIGATFDHRVVTGGRGAQFLGIVKRMLEKADNFNLSP